MFGPHLGDWSSPSIQYGRLPRVDDDQLADPFDQLHQRLLLVNPRSGHLCGVGSISFPERERVDHLIGYLRLLDRPSYITPNSLEECPKGIDLLLTKVTGLELSDVLPNLMGNLDLAPTFDAYCPFPKPLRVVRAAAGELE